MNIKKEPMEQHFKRDGGYQAELRVAQCFEGTFVVDSAFCKDGYSVWIANPSDALMGRFGFDRELVVIYSRHQRTHARVLDTLKEVAKLSDYRDRIEQAIAILVHSGDQRQAVDVCRSKDWVLVPLSKKDLLESEDATDLITSSIARHIGMVDIFGVSSPLDSDKYFFGRNDLVQKIIARGESGRNNHGLFGLRKTGKTSVLLAAKRRLTRRPVLVVYLDLQTSGYHNRPWWSLLEVIKKRCVSEMQKKQSMMVPLLSRDRYTESNAAGLFADDITAMLEPGGAQQVFLLLDEIEHITPGISGKLGRHWDHHYSPFWAAIRSVHQETDGRLSFVVAGVNQRCISEPSFEDEPNPVFQLAQPHIIEPFDSVSVREMVEKLGRYSGIEFDDDVFDFISVRYGGYPYLTRVACSVVVQAKDHTGGGIATIGTADFIECEDEINARLRDPIADMLLSFVWWFGDEYFVLEALAADEHELVREYFESDPAAALRLRKWGIVRDGRLGVPVMRYYLQRFGEEYKRRTSPYARKDLPIDIIADGPNFEVLQELTTARWTLETKLRQAIIAVEGAAHGYDKQRMASAILAPLRRRERNLHPADFFIGRTFSEGLENLYLLELGQIIVNDWERFSPLFGESEDTQALFEMNMRLVNKARVMEAHTKTASVDDLENFKPAFSWFMVYLSRVPEYR